MPERRHGARPPHTGHHHPQPDRERCRRGLTIALGLTLAVFAAGEVLAVWRAVSLALLADAGHMLTDAAALVLALLVRVDGEPSGPRPAHLRLAAGRDLAALAKGWCWC
jgi:Co/Zn/Cd efflux system component